MDVTGSAIGRKGGPKRSRNGCITCKIRRVKCDETRPICNRCVQTGRACDGYPTAGTPSQHQTRRGLAAAVRQLHVVGPASRVLGKPLPVDDVACFDFFRLCTASMTSSFFPGQKFWSFQLLQAAHVEPAVWRAAVSLGALHRRWEYSNNSLSESATRRPSLNQTSCGKENSNDVILFSKQAMKHYAASVSLAKNIKDPFIMAVLSVALSAAAHLAGSWSDSQLHICAGTRLLREIQKSSPATVGSSTITNPGRSSLLPADLQGAAQVLERLDAQAMTLSDATSPYKYSRNDVLRSKLLLVGDNNAEDDGQGMCIDPATLLGPMTDLGQAALAIFRLLRHFFIIVHGLTTGVLSPHEFEQARLQMINVTNQWEEEVGFLVNQADSKSEQLYVQAAGNLRSKNEREQTVLILSLRLYHATVELLLLAHGPQSLPVHSLRLPLDPTPAPTSDEADTEPRTFGNEPLVSRLAKANTAHDQGSSPPTSYTSRSNRPLTPFTTPAQSNPPPPSQPPSQDHTDSLPPTAETRWDTFNDHFAHIISLASSIASNTDSPLPFFMSLEPGLAMPLYLTVIRCRHPVTRRRALALLRKLNRQEGIWNCALAARAAEEVVVLEEGAMLATEDGDDGDEGKNGREGKGDDAFMPMDLFEREIVGGAMLLLGEFRDRVRKRVVESDRSKRSEDNSVASDELACWDDGWPKIPEEKRVLVQYPIFRLEKHQLELLMFVVGDMKSGEGKVARRVVLDMF